ERSLLLLFLVHHNAAGAGLLFGLGLFRGHGLVDPLVGCLQVGGMRFLVVALNIGALAVHQVHVGHGVVIVGTKLQGLVQIVDAFLHVRRIFLPHLGTNLFVLGREGIVGFHPKFGARFLARLVGLRPVDHGHRIVRLRVVGVGIRRLLVEVLGHVKLFHLQIQVRDALDAVDVLGIHLQHLFVLVNRLLSVFVVVGSIGPRDVLLRERCR